MSVNTILTKVREYVKTQLVERNIEYALNKYCSDKVLRPDSSFLRFVEILQDPKKSKPIPIMDDNGEVIIHVFVSCDFKKGLSSSESKFYSGKIPRWTSERLVPLLTKILTKRIVRNESLDSLCLKDKGYFQCYYTKNLPVLLHSIGCALAVYHGLLTHIRENPKHSSSFFKHGKVIIRRSSRNFPILSLVTHFLRVLPRNVPEAKLVKLIKLAFCGNFSLKAGQELPEGFEKDGFPLMPSFMEKYVESRFATNYGDLVKLYFTLQQSKGLCQAVPSSFLKEGLEKHRAGLVRDDNDLIPLDEELYSKLRDFSSKMMGSYIKENYDPFKGYIPNRNSCLEKSRGDGGSFGAVVERGGLKRGVNPLNQDAWCRIEPFVIGLFGTPGVGKSTLIRNIVNYLSRHMFNDRPYEDLIYSRSCSVTHWDGYHDQPIVILDDWAQNTQFSDVSEFAQLISTNPYVLPMAHLDEKGKMFTSPIIIVTSNVPFGGDFSYNDMNPIVDTYAIWRRFHLPLLVKREGKKLVYKKLKIDPIYGQPDYVNYQKNLLREQEYSRVNNGESRPDNKKLSASLYIEHDESYTDLSEILSSCTSLLEERIHYHNCFLTGRWTQDVGHVSLGLVPNDHSLSYNLVENSSSYGQGLHTYIDFPLYPPEHLPKCKVVALSEPLKVRVITAGESDLKCLQSLQKTMWNALKQYPQFCLTHGISHEQGEGKNSVKIFNKMEKEINRIRDYDEHSLWLSGDYTAATDNLPMWVTRALMEGILDHIDHEPTKRWALYEIGQHELIYPKEFGIEPGIQSSGQLMGSLLSFPLLCLANAFIVEYSGISPKNYLVNGDDIVASTSEQCILNWKINAPRIGLSLSLGKNFISKEFCTVNSQLFVYDEKSDQMAFKCTGKVNLLRRGISSSIGDTYRDFQRLYGIEDIFHNVFVSNNYHLLTETPASLQVPRSHGGLGDVFVNGRTINQKLAKTVYMAELDKRIYRKVEKTFSNFTNGFVPVFSPYWAKPEGKIPDGNSELVYNKVQSLCLPKEQKNETLYENDDLNVVPELTNREYREFSKKLDKDYTNLKCIIDNATYKVQNFPSFENLCFEIHYVHEKHFRKVQDYFNQSFLTRFIEYIKDEQDIGELAWYNEDLNFNDFYESIKESTCITLSDIVCEDLLTFGEKSPMCCPLLHESGDLYKVDSSKIILDERFEVLDNNLWYDERNYVPPVVPGQPITLKDFRF